MSELTGIEAVIYNEGERLIPGVTHDRAELVRHRSSYVFWRTIISLDQAKLGRRLQSISIVDLGCGVGHGCMTLAALPGAHVLGVDSSAESLDYAHEHYAADNIEYVRADLEDYIREMPPFDYAVSRGVMEHIPNGLELTRAAEWRNRLMFDVPYDENPGLNPHHVVHNVRGMRSLGSRTPKSSFRISGASRTTFARSRSARTWSCASRAGPRFRPSRGSCVFRCERGPRSRVSRGRSCDGCSRACAKMNSARCFSTAGFGLPRSRGARRPPLDGRLSALPRSRGARRPPTRWRAHLMRVFRRAHECSEAASPSEVGEAKSARPRIGSLQPSAVPG